MVPIKFEQIPLFTGGYRLLTTELYLHFNGTSNEIEVGYSIKATDTQEWVEGGTLGIVGHRVDTDSLAPVLDALIQRTLQNLSPFG